MKKEENIGKKYIYTYIPQSVPFPLLKPPKTNVQPRTHYQHTLTPTPIQTHLLPPSFYKPYAHDHLPQSTSPPTPTTHRNRPALHAHLCLPHTHPLVHVLRGRAYTSSSCVSYEQCPQSPIMATRTHLLA